MTRVRTAAGFAIVVLAMLAWGGAAEAQRSTIVLPRPGQIGLGVQGGFGTLLESGPLGEEFANGGSLAVRLRYRMRYERGFGLAFENQRFDRRDGGKDGGAFLPFQDVEDSLLTRSRINVVTAGVELYQMFGTRTRTARMLSVGAGLAQVSATLSNGENQSTKDGDGVYLSLGAGVEHFFWRSLAFDTGVRYFTLFHGGEAHHDLQVAAGLIFYAGY